MAGSILLNGSLQNILLGIDKRLIPCQVSQFLVTPFFVILTINSLDFRDFLTVPDDLKDLLCYFKVYVLDDVPFLF